MAESQELILKEKREQAARNALEVDKLAAGNEFEDTDFLSRMTSGASGEPEPTIEEMIRDAPTLEDTIRDGPSARSLTLPTMLTPEQKHEANKDFLKFVAEDVAANAALGGAGALAKAGFGWLPLNMETVKTIRKLLGTYKHKRAPSGRVRFDWPRPEGAYEADVQLTNEAAKELKELWRKHAPKTTPRQVALPSKHPRSFQEWQRLKGEFGPHVDRERVGLPWYPGLDAIEMKTNLRMNLRQAGINPDEVRDLSDEEFLRVLKEARVSDPEGFPMSNLDAFKKAREKAAKTAIEKVKKN